MDALDVPDDYIFRSYFGVIVWGQFPPINEQLKILMTRTQPNQLMLHYDKVSLMRKLAKEHRIFPLLEDLQKTRG